MNLWGRQSPTNIVAAFIRAANDHDAAALAAVLSPDARYIDSNGDAIRGRDAVIAALMRLHELAPDFRFEINDTSQRGDYVLLSGQAISQDARLTKDTQWRALVEHGQLVEWQSYSPTLAPSMARILAGSPMDSAA